MQLVLNTTHFYQMFGDDNFYKTLPPGFEPLVEPCKESHARALRIAMGQEEDPCSGCTTIRQALDKSINALGKQLHAVYRVDPDVLQPLKQYFCARLKQEIREVVLYYKDAEKTAEAEGRERH